MPKKRLGKEGHKNSLRKQICRKLIASIESGEYPPGSPLPPSRELAEKLGVSRDTVVRSFADLQSMFYIESSSTRGFYVSKPSTDQRVLVKPKLPASGSVRLSDYGERLLDDHKKFLFTPDFSNLNYGAPPRELLPIRRWQLHIRHYANATPQLNYRPQVLGISPLRESMAGFLNRSKNLGCVRNEVILFSGTLSAMNLLCRLLLNPGETVAVEEPGFGGIRNIASEHGATLLKVPVDREGMIVDVLNRNGDVRLVYITPGHHDPTGSVLSLERREQLIAWAKNNNAWIIEDDFDGHFQYEKSPLPCLKAIDKDDRVIYLSTLWKVLYPLSNIGYCVLPKPLIALVEKVKINADGFSEVLTQQALAAMIDEGYLERYIRRLQKIYRARRSSLLYSLKKVFGQRIVVHGETSGTYCLVTFIDCDESSVLQAAQMSGLPLVSIAGYYFENPPPSQFIIDFSRLDEKEMFEVVTNFAFWL
ncbi:MAG: PLP-dependent aminotransferase family protein [Candidatus Obscuribacterales bacterium]|nr:PLP-dependent aminotransferase family protein [Candidatus Obscuribacterales bacterium]